jgi:hypothetical protein
MGAAQAADGLCDRTLPSPPDDAQGYRERGDRCEGRYLRNVTSTTVWPVSLTEVFEPFDASRDKALQVSWPAVDAGIKEVALRAESVKRRVYYRMDTRRPAADRKFSWPTQVLWALEMTSGDLGVLASTSLPVASVPRVVYLPARVTRGATAQPGAGYSLALMPGIELEELSTGLVRVGDDGRETVLRPLMPLRYGYYPALRAVSIELPKNAFPARGVYRIELVARLAGSGASRSELWLYHAGP